MQYEIVDGRLMADDGDTGITVLVHEGDQPRVRHSKDDRTVFRRDGKGLASYSGIHWSTATMRFVRDHLGDRWGGVILGRF